MKRFFGVFAFVCALLSVSVMETAAQTASLAPSRRVVINLGQTAWQYLKDTDPANAHTPGFDDSGWQSVGVPTSADMADTFINTESGGGAGYLSGSVIWYRHHFKLDNQYADRKVVVEFEGAHTGVQVYLNGTFLPGNSAINPQATHVVGFVPFAVDLTPYLKFNGADNVLAVRVAKNANWFEDPNFSEGFRFGQSDSGLFRPVVMYLTDKVYIPRNTYAGLGTWGTYVATTSASSTQATVRVQTNVVNEGTGAQPVTLTTQIVDASGNVVATAQSAQTVPASATLASGAQGLVPQLFDQTLTVNNPTLWYPNNSTDGKPYLYKVLHTVSVNGAVIDAVQSPLGIRTITWDKDLPYFNGKPQYLWGASGRYDYPALDTSVPEEQQWRDLQQLAAAGGNLWRPGHSSTSEEFVNAADAYGVMIVQPSGDGENGFAYPCDPTCDKGTLKQELHRDMILRDRNHPSILAWEADNGITDTPFAVGLHAIANQWDFLTPRVQADRTPNSANGDILGCTLEGCEVLVKQEYPNNPAWGAEYWGTGSARGAWDSELAFASPFLDNWRKGRKANAFGMAQWYFADTPGESSNFIEGTVHTIVRSLGASMVDQNRFPKLLYYIYQAAWTPYAIRPVVALAHHWNRTGAVQVNAFSNCPAVRLLLNGVAQGTDQVPNPWTSDTSANLTQNTTAMPFQVSWNVNWAAGTLKAECLDAGRDVVVWNNQPVVDQKTTAGNPDHVELDVVPELTKPDGTAFAITANGTDAAFVVAKVVDAAGVVVPTATNNITFAVSGPGTYLGGTEQTVTPGQPLGYHSPGDHELAAEGGLTKVVVRSQFAAGTVTVSATSPGLGSGTATFTVSNVVDTNPTATTPEIIAEPVDTAVTAGQPAHFSVAASGAPTLAFQWQRNGAAIPGATASAYTSPATTSADTGAVYSVVVSNALGSAPSNPAKLTVVAPAAVTITAQPQAQTAFAYQTAQFAVTATGSPALSYQWLRNGAVIPGATASTYTTPVLGVADSGAAFSVTVTNPVNAVTSASAALTVNAPVGPAIVTAPVAASVAPGQQAVFGVVVSGSAPIRYQWQKDGVDVGTNSATLTIASVGNSDLGNYTVTASNAAGTVTSTPVALALAPPGFDLALGKAAVASSYQDPIGMPAGAAFDGNLTTRWGSDYSNAAAAGTQWLQVDLGAVMTFNRVILHWDPAYASAYQIQVSNDATTWTKAYEQDNGVGGVEDFSFPTVQARYVRMYGTTRGTQYGYSLDEFAIYNSANCGGATERYTVNAGNNTVLDNLSGLTWMRAEYTLTAAGSQLTQSLAAAYCQSNNMRLPTEDEALAISGTSASTCAFPAPWHTWSSTDYATDATYAWTVDSTGNAVIGIKNNLPGWALCTAGATAVAPVITTQPAPTTVAAGQSAQFNVAASGGMPITFEWMKNGTPVALTGVPVYTTPVTAATDNGALFSVLVTGSNGLRSTSSTAPLTINGTVTPTPTPPGTNPPTTPSPSGPAPTGPNLALDMPATASSTENAGYLGAANAVDGSLTTRWGSDFSNAATANTQWLQVDLGASKAIGQMVLSWEAAYGKAYQIQVSDDAQTWTTAYTQSSGQGGTENFTFPGVTGRYVRLYATARGTGYGYSLYEFAVDAPVLPTITTQPASVTAVAGSTAQFAVVAGGTGPFAYQWRRNGVTVSGATAASYTTAALSSADNGGSYTVVISNAGGSVTSSAAVLSVAAATAGMTNLALNRPATSSANEGAGYAPGNAVDGNLSTRWSSAFVDPSWIAVDLGSPLVVSKVVLRWEAAYGKAYTIQVSSDGQTWTTAYTQTAGNGGTETLTFPAVVGRYVRMYGTARGTGYGYSLYEFEVYGADVPSITTQPMSQTVAVGATASLGVMAGGTGPFTYQWLKNGVTISGAMAASYTTPVLAAADSGSSYTVAVTNASGTVTSTAAIVTVGSAGYTIYPGFLGTDLNNNTNGAWSDAQIYVTVIGIDPATGVFATVKPDGTMTDVAVADNTAAGHLTKNGQSYPNYSFTLAQSKLLKLPQMSSGRVFVSMGEPVYLKVLADANGHLGYAGPNPQNGSDPNTNVHFDWYEFTYNANGVYINTTQVDEFGLPLLLDVWGAGGSFHQQTGITESIAQIDGEFANEVPAAFQPTPVSNLRIFSPAKLTFGAGGANGSYFDSYISSVWSQYSTTPLVVNLFGSRRFSGTTAGSTFTFQEVNLNNGAYVGNTYTIAKPSTQDVLLCAGTMASGNANNADINAVELQLEAQMCAAFNRHAMADVTTWATPSAWYSAPPANFYAQFWHKHAVGGLAYGFAYDDVSGQSSTITTGKPEHMAFGIGW